MMLRIFVVALSFLFFAFSLSQKSFKSGNTIVGSLDILLLGGFAILFNGFTGLLWLCNVFVAVLWFSLILVNTPEKDKKYFGGILGFSFFNFLLAASFLTVTEIHNGSMASADVSKIQEIYLGYYLWLTSMGLMFFGALFIYLFEKNQKNKAF